MLNLKIVISPLKIFKLRKKALLCCKAPCTEQRYFPFTIVSTRVESLAILVTLPVQLVK
jgi:hypothetical protein